MEQIQILTREKCPVCGHVKTSPYLTCKDHTVSGEYFDIVGCEDCGFKFTNPIPVPERIGHYYKSESYISHTGTRKGLIAWLYHRVRRHTLRQKLSLVSKRAQKGHVLDYGCGTGNFLEVCLQAGWRVTGLEPDADARSRVNKDISVYGDLGSLEREHKETEYSLVTLWHVLEHVYDLESALGFFREHLASNGVLVIAVPNHRSFDANHYGAFWAAFDVPRHLYHFDRLSMGKLAAGKGFTVEEVLPMKFDSYYVSLLSERYRGRGIGGLFSAVLTGFRSNVSAARTGEYSSLVYILRRSKST